MPRCPYCDCELIGFDTLCDDCYEKRRVEVDTPRSVIQSLRQFVWNPLDLTDGNIVEMKTMAIWRVPFLWCSGLLLCWFGGWAKAHYQCPILSGIVLRGMLQCVVISLALSLAIARRGLHVSSRVVRVRAHVSGSDPAFEPSSILMSGSGHFYIGSNAIRSLAAKAIKW